MLNENDVAKVIVDCAYRVHVRLGPGLLESVYEITLAYELTKQGLKVERQKAIPLIYEGIVLGDSFRADLVVNELIIVEIKSLETVPLVARKVLLTYLRLTDLKLGLLINFGEEFIRDGIKRVVNGLE
jgi:GxxExxY protein